MAQSDKTTRLTNKFGSRTYSMRVRAPKTTTLSPLAQDQTPELITCEPDLIEDSDASKIITDDASKLISLDQAKGSNSSNKQNKARYRSYGKRARLESSVVPVINDDADPTFQIEEAALEPDCRAPTSQFIAVKKNEIRDHLLANDPTYLKYETEIEQKKYNRFQRKAELEKLTDFRGMLKIRLETIKKQQVPDFCRKCNEEFKCEWDVITHISIEHSNYVDPIEKSKRTDKGLTRDYVCPTCLTRFTTLERLASHNLAAHGKEMIDPRTKEPVEPAHWKIRKERAEGLICETCGKINKMGPSGLRRHILSFHTRPEDRPFPCDFENCQRTFVTPNKLVEHRRVHKELKLFSCPHDGCEKTFHKERNLREHVRALHKKIRFKCKICGHESQSKSGREYHVKKEHVKTKDRCCPHCEFASLTTGNLKLHIKNMHKDKLDENGEVTKEDSAKFMTYVHPDRYIAQQAASMVDQLQNSENEEPSTTGEVKKSTKQKGPNPVQPVRRSGRIKLTKTVIEPVVDSDEDENDSKNDTFPVVDSVTEFLDHNQSINFTNVSANHQQNAMLPATAAYATNAAYALTSDNSRFCPMCERFFTDLTFHFTNFHRISSSSYLQALNQQIHSSYANYYNNFT